MSHPTASAITQSPLDQELEWYFSYAETALRLGRVALLPAHEAIRLPAKSDDDVIHRALQLATHVQLTLHAVSPQHAAVLRAGYTPRRWPTAVVREFESLTAIAVRLACAAHPWPERSGHDGLEQAAALHLARMLIRSEATPAALRKQARGLLRSAMTAYERARENAFTAAPSTPTVTP